MPVSRRSWLAAPDRGSAVIGDLTRSFSAWEFRQKDPLVPVPDSLLRNVRRQAQNLQVLRDELGAAVIITSGYRTEAHNAGIGGATNSQHVTAKAADFTVRGVAQPEVYCTILRLIQEGRMEDGGLGYYGPDGHIHYDVRGSRARWNEAPLPVCAEHMEEEDDMAVQELKRQQDVAGLFAQAQGYALRGKPLPAALRAQIKYLLG